MNMMKQSTSLAITLFAVDLTYTVSQKVSHLTLVNNFGKCRPIFKTLLPIDVKEIYLCIHHEHFHLTCSILLHYLVKVESTKKFY